MSIIGHKILYITYQIHRSLQREQMQKQKNRNFFTIMANKFSGNSKPTFRQYTAKQLEVILVKTRVILNKEIQRLECSIRNSDSKLIKLNESNQSQQYDLFQEIGQKIIQINAIKILITLVKKLEDQVHIIIEAKGKVERIEQQIKWLKCILWFRHIKQFQRLEDLKQFCYNYFSGVDITEDKQIEVELYTQVKNANIKLGEIPLDIIKNQLDYVINKQYTTQRKQLIFNRNRKYINNFKKNYASKSENFRPIDSHPLNLHNPNNNNFSNNRNRNEINSVNNFGFNNNNPFNPTTNNITYNNQNNFPNNFINNGFNINGAHHIDRNKPTYNNELYPNFELDKNNKSPQNKYHQSQDYRRKQKQFYEKKRKDQQQWRKHNQLQENKRIEAEYRKKLVQQEQKRKREEQQRKRIKQKLQQQSRKQLIDTQNKRRRQQEQRRRIEDYEKKLRQNEQKRLLYQQETYKKTLRMNQQRERKRLLEQQEKRKLLDQQGKKQLKQGKQLFNNVQNHHNNQEDEQQLNIRKRMEMLSSDFKLLPTGQLKQTKQIEYTDSLDQNQIFSINVIKQVLKSQKKGFIKKPYMISIYARNNYVDQINKR